jgi:hypothetical protein
MGSPGDSAAPAGSGTGPPPEFARAAESLRSALVRPDVTLRSTPAPTRLAPFAEAVTLEIAELATARLVYLHDPQGQEAWDGQDRLVGFARTALEPEMAADPLLAEVTWSWLSESLAARGLALRVASGTVTVTSHTRFGGIASAGTSHDLELRCSWSPVVGELDAHAAAFADLLAAMAGLPPAGREVVSLSRRRR